MKKFANAPIVLLVVLFWSISLKPAFPQGMGIFLENATIDMGLVTVSPSKVAGSASNSAGKPGSIGNIRLEAGSPGEFEVPLSSREEENARLLVKVSAFESPGGIKGDKPGESQTPGNDIREDSQGKTIKKTTGLKNTGQADLTAHQTKSEIVKKSTTAANSIQTSSLTTKLQAKPAKLQSKPKVKPVVKSIVAKAARQIVKKRVKRVAVKPARYAGKRVKRVAVKPARHTVKKRVKRVAVKPAKAKNAAKVR